MNVKTISGIIAVVLVWGVIGFLQEDRSDSRDWEFHEERYEDNEDATPLTVPLTSEQIEEEMYKERNKSVRFVNNSDITIHRLNISRTYDQDGGDNKINNSLRPGCSTKITMADKLGVVKAQYDIRVNNIVLRCVVLQLVSHNTIVFEGEAGSYRIRSCYLNTMRNPKFNW